MELYVCFSLLLTVIASSMSFLACARLSLPVVDSVVAAVVVSVVGVVVVAGVVVGVVVVGVVVAVGVSLGLEVRLSRDLGSLSVGATAPQVHVADVESNANAIVEAIGQAGEAGVQVLAFPEMALTGYTVQDLVSHKALLSSVRKGLDMILAESAKHSMLILVGLPLEVDGKLFNCAVALGSGGVLGIVPKSYLPSSKEYYENRWFIDPLDGTTNFARGIPYFAVSIALEEAGDLRLGVLYEPLGDHLFQAEAGQGAWLNGECLRVSECGHLIDAILDLGWGRGQAVRQASVGVAETLGPHIGVVRSMGSAALGLAAVAAGWEDAFYHPELASWDMAAGALLVREAGGVITRADGQPWDVSGGTCLASNGQVHEALVELIAPQVAL